MCISSLKNFKFVLCLTWPITIIRVACFTTDGKLCATGSVDASLKIMDVERMVHKSQQQQNNQHVRF